MRFPAFFNDIPSLRVRDPLAQALGCAEDGILEYHYADAVRLVGHSCPTVAAAYWLTWLALHELYGDATPERGGVRVEMRYDPRTGCNGVVATIIQMLTGAAGGTGFKGFNGRFSRVGLQRLAPDLPMSLRFTRMDTRDAVDATSMLSMVPADPQMEELAARCGTSRNQPDDWAALGRYWQRTVQTMLLELAHDPGVFIVQRVDRVERHRWMATRLSAESPPPAGAAAPLRRVCDSGS